MWTSFSNVELRDSVKVTSFNNLNSTIGKRKVFASHVVNIETTVLFRNFKLKNALCRTKVYCIITLEYRHEINESLDNHETKGKKIKIMNIKIKIKI